ncbi:MAG: N-6 DNA methylase [Planctomycetota bacterium]|nr:N-6 DNA methylase [Planctomycetota bacterium]
MKATKAQKSKGQFFTPTNVADFVWELLDTSGAWDDGRPARVIDPAAGEGVFIQSGAHHLTDAEFVAVDIDPAMRNHWDGLADGRLQGVLGNGLSNGAGSSTSENTLADPPIQIAEGEFDIVIGNPPFGGDGVKRMLREFESDPSTEADLLRSLLRLETWQRRPMDRRGIQEELERIPPGPNIQKALAQLKRCRIEMLFFERFVRLARPGGWVAIILPDGLLANDRHRHLRDWVAERAELRAIVTFPRATFVGVNTNAFTSLVVLQKNALTGATEPDSPVLLANPNYSDDCRADAPRVPRIVPYLNSVLSAARNLEDSEFTVRVASDQLTPFRWHTGYFHPNLRIPTKANTRFPLRPLGDFITHITYGPIITGRKTAEEPSGPVRIIGQGELGDTGLIFNNAASITEESDFNPPRSRPQAGDLLIARSGMGALAKNRMSIFPGGFKANVGCFVDVVRIEGLNPFYVWLFLKTDFGFDQIRRFYNGVGTLNISFNEIRSIQIPVARMEMQDEVERRYREDVLPLHASERFEKAKMVFDRLRDWVRQGTSL